MLSHMMADILQIASMVLFPRSCAGCGARDSVLCDACSQLFLRWRERSIAHSFTVFSCGQYTRAVRNAVLAWKDHGDEELDALLAGFLAERIICVLKNILSTDVQVCVAPAPSSPKSVQSRGRAHMNIISIRIVQQINAYTQQQGSNCRAHMCPCLHIDAKIRKSVTASHRKERAERLSKGLLYEPQHAGDAEGSKRCTIILDDIVTSGATLRACVRLLRSRGEHVLAAFTLSDADRHTPDNAYYA